MLGVKTPPKVPSDAERASCFRCFVAVFPTPLRPVWTPGGA